MPADLPFDAAHPSRLSPSTGLGRLRVHLRRTTSTNDRARELAVAGAPHGTLVTAAEQSAGRGRMGRRWEAPAGSALLMSLLLRAGDGGLGQPAGSTPPESFVAPGDGGRSAPLSLLAGVAVCDVAGPQARVKWPNDVVVPDGAALRKLAGILVEGRPQEDWAVVGIGLNVAVRLEEMPAELRDTAATLGLAQDAIEPTLARLLAALERRLVEPASATLEAWRELDALQGREVSWAEGETTRVGRAAGIDDAGRLIVTTPDGARVTVEAGEVCAR